MRRSLICFFTAAVMVLTACAADEDGLSAPTTPEPLSPPAQQEPTTDSPASEGAPDDGAADDDEVDADENAPREVTLAAIGDVLPHFTLNRSASAYAGGEDGAYDYDPMFADVAPVISAADLALCHLETPISSDNTNLSVPDTLSFNSPYQLADALATAGIDGCDFASNHTMDRGLAGVSATQQVLGEAGLGYAGPSPDADGAGEAEVYTVDTEGGSVSLAHLAYTYTYPNDGSPTTHIPGEAPWLVEASWPSIGSAGILEQAAAAREDGAHFVVVSMHWGQEYQVEPTADQSRIARELLESPDVDLILGTHVHVIQPCESINGKHVLYGLGNFLSNQSPQTNVNLGPRTQEGVIAQVTLRRDEQGTVTSELSYHPTRVEISEQIVPSHIVRLVSPETYPETWERTTATIDQLGGCQARAVDPLAP